MAEDDSFDLDDDDLDLGDESDDSGDGDDFAGELDEMMGDDELGDDDGGDGDGELDSFFEDLSSIEDVEEADDDQAAPAPAAEPKAEAAPAPAAAPVVKEKKGGALKWILMIFGVLILLGGGAYWFLFTEEEPPVMEETTPAESMFSEDKVIEVELPKEPPKPIIEVEKDEPAPPPPPVIKKPVMSKYLIQIATCSFDKCKNDYTAMIRKQGEPVFYRKAKENYDFIELISKEVFSYRKAKYLVDKINRKNKLAGNASIKDQSNGFRVTMGNFTALDRAKEVKFYIEKRLPQSDLTFVMEHVQQDYQTTKVFAGPFDNRKEAKEVLAEFRRKNVFPGAFLVRY